MNKNETSDIISVYAINSNIFYADARQKRFFKCALDISDIKSCCLIKCLSIITLSCKKENSHLNRKLYENIISFQYLWINEHENLFQCLSYQMTWIAYLFENSFCTSELKNHEFYESLEYILQNIGLWCDICAKSSPTWNTCAVSWGMFSTSGGGTCEYHRGWSMLWSNIIE